MDPNYLFTSVQSIRLHNKTVYYLATHVSLLFRFKKLYVFTRLIGAALTFPAVSTFLFHFNLNFFQEEYNLLHKTHLNALQVSDFYKVN